MIVNVVGMAALPRSRHVLGSLNAALLHFTKCSGRTGRPPRKPGDAVNPGLTTTDRRGKPSRSGPGTRDTNEASAPHLKDKVPWVGSTRPRMWPKHHLPLLGRRAPATGSASNSRSIHQRVFDMKECGSSEPFACRTSLLRTEHR